MKHAFEQYKDEVFGTVDYTEGTIRLTELIINGLYTNDGVLNVFATPRYPDFFTKRNNIVIIDDYKVNVTMDYENESDKS